ncbi:MAG: M18 family aminopeptidase [Erysipelotrichaceae bacterium]|jgi:aspartyl aminopeptidase|nr:M18 family aminopeptidase [Erysipelotrichaceae bacterium]
MYNEIAKDLLSFITKNPTQFHVIDNTKKELLENGFTELLEGQPWKLEQGKSYFVTRNYSAIIAFKMGTDLHNYSFNITAAHSDSPAFKIKEHAELSVKGKYMQLNTEGYGGMLDAPWFDRPLSVAGRVLVKNGDSYETRLLNVDRDLLVIPNVAIHMNRTVNDGYTYNAQVDMLPLFAGADAQKGAFKELIASELGVKKEDIYGTDLFLYSRVQPSIWGLNNEFISCGKLDDQQCVYASLKAFLKGYNERSVNVFCVFDNEEVGSGTKQGASSTFLYDVLQRINTGLGKEEEEYYRAVASSFMLSADNAHAVHPNHPEKTDAENCVYMNEGIVIKFSANQKYTTDAISEAVFKGICEKVNVPVQYFHNRSDMAGGSTLGNLSSLKVSLNMVDIGLPQLAMHSSYETAGIKDTYYMIEAMTEFFNSHVEETGCGTLKVTR